MLCSPLMVMKMMLIHGVDCCVLIYIQTKGKFDYRRIKFCWVNERWEYCLPVAVVLYHPLMVMYDDAVMQGLIVVIVDLMFLSD